jgi:putative addiction module antidote
MAPGRIGDQVGSRWRWVALEYRYNLCYNIEMNKHVTISSSKVTTVGNSIGISLPKEVLAILRVGKGDSLCFTETPEGVLLTPYSEEFAAQMEAAETVMREDRDVLRILAK